MNTDLIHDLLHYYFQKCSKDRSTFVSTFSTSDYIIGYHYRLMERRFTEVSRSFKTILGYSLKNVLNNDAFISKIVHPADRPVVREFLNNKEIHVTEKDLKTNKFSTQCLKIKAHHITGYWRHLIMYGTNDLNHESNGIEKIGLFVKEQIRKSQVRNLKSDFRDSGTAIVHSQHIAPKQYDTKSDKISLREREILELISEGLITKEIAVKLYISNGTVATHRRNLMSKLNVKNTAELVKVASDRMLFTFLSS